MDVERAETNLVVDVVPDIRLGANKVTAKKKIATTDFILQRMAQGFFGFDFVVLNGNRIENIMGI
jgi:hypothetical protein